MYNNLTSALTDAPNDPGMTMGHILAQGPHLACARSLHGDLEVDRLCHVHLLIEKLS